MLEEENVIGYECKFIIHQPETKFNRDTHYIKETVYYKDGTTKPNLRILEDYQRSFWVTKPFYRKHKNKKESEDLSKLDEYKTTQSRCHQSAGRVLGGKYMRARSLRDINISPYIYGLDTDSRTILKQAYFDKYKLFSAFKVAAFDIEVDTITNEIIVLSICTVDKIYIAVNKKFKRTVEKETLINMFFNNLPFDNNDKYVDKNKVIGMEYVIEYYEDEITTLKEAFRYSHTLDIDIMAVWNINYDIGNIILKRLELYGVSPLEVFPEPSLPEKCKFFNYKEDSQSVLTEGGVYKAKAPEDQWHSVFTPCNYIWLDAMSAYKIIRLGMKSMGLGLDNVLKKEIGHGKMKLDGDTNLTGIDWHRFMVAEKKSEYIVYNMWDTMSMIILDNKTKDLSVSLPTFSSFSTFDIFKSGPKKVVNDLFFYYLSHDKVLGTKDPIVADNSLLGTRDWIVLQPLYRVKDKGMKIGNTDMSSNIRSHVYDIDQKSGYPSNTVALNVSGDTIVSELIDIEGIEKETFKEQNMGLLMGKVSSVEYCTTMFNFPKLEDLVD